MSDLNSQRQIAKLMIEKNLNRSDLVQELHQVPGIKVEDFKKNVTTFGVKVVDANAIFERQNSFEE